MENLPDTLASCHFCGVLWPACLLNLFWICEVCGPVISEDWAIMGQHHLYEPIGRGGGQR